MKEGSLKIVIAISEVYPLLVADIARYSVERRAERLRSLATVGLQLEGRYLAVGTEKWDHKPEAIELPSFALVINDAHPILFNILKSTPARMRAERLRNLANLGLHVGRGLLRIEDSHLQDGALASSEMRQQLHSGKPAHSEAQSSTYRSAIAVQARPKSESAVEERRAAGMAVQVDSDSSAQIPVDSQAPDSQPVAPETTNPAPAKNKVGKGVRSFARFLGN